MKLIFKLVKWLVSFILIIVVAGSVYISYETVQQITHLSDPQQSKENSIQMLKEHQFDFEAFKQKYDYTESNIPSSFQDHDISFANIAPSNAKRGTVVMAHGLGGSKESVFIQAKVFLDLGYHVVAYDQRNSGDNTADTNTFGVHESKDMIDIIQTVQKNYQPQSLIVWGESFGGATATLAVAELGNDFVDGLILDSPMNDGKSIVEMNMAEIPEQTGLPMAYLMFLGDLGLKVSQNFSFEDAMASKRLQGNTTPLLVIHSKTDSVIPYEMGQAIYEASASKDKQLHTVEKGEHVMLVHENPKTYQQVITDFLSDK